jgi:AraC-like DNA-binding protein
MRLDISTDDVPERDRLDFWSAAISNALALSVQKLPDTTEPFRARLGARANGPMLHCDFDADRFRVTRQRGEIARKHWDSYWIYQEASAGAWFRIGDEEFVTRPGDLIIADTDVPFESSTTGHYNHELWMLPKALVDPHLPALGRPLLARLSDRSGVDALAADYLASVTRNWEGISPAAMGPVADTLSRLIGVACGTSAGAQPDAVRFGRLAEARRHIERHLANPELSPASVAAAMGIAVRTLHEVFEPAGTSFARYVLRRRLEECRTALLGNPTRPVIDIAFAWGFGSLSSFYRAFQAAFGMSPGDVREAARDAGHF